MDDLDLLLQRAWQVRQAHFPPVLGADNPRRTRALSLTGRACALDCAHCGRHYLEAMLPADGLSPGDVRLVGATSLLVSGGCDPRGRVPVTAHLDLLRALRPGRRLNWHTGLITEQDLAAIAGLADAISFDLVGDDETIAEVYGLEATVEDYRAAYRRLRRAVPVIPHITIGLRGGRLSGEREALRIVREEGATAIVFLVLIPTPGTRYARCSPPALEEVARLLAEARLSFPHTPLLLGCMRPGGGYRRALDALALRAGINRIVKPQRATLELAAGLGLKVERGEECCVLALIPPHSPTPHHEVRPFLAGSNHRDGNVPVGATHQATPAGSTAENHGNLRVLCALCGSVLPVSLRLHAPLKGPNLMARGEKPASLRVSAGTEAVLGLRPTALETAPTTAYLMLDGGGCAMACAFCAQARGSTAHAGALSRVTWPAHPSTAVLAALQRAPASLGRICLQVTLHRGAREEVLALVRRLRQASPLPISAAFFPSAVSDVGALLAGGVEFVGLGLDCASERVYRQVKGAGWGRMIALVEESCRRYPGRVRVHLMVGLGESEEELCRRMQQVYDWGGAVGLFAFTPVRGTPLQDRPQPPLGVYRRMQAARYLLHHGLDRAEQFLFDGQGRLLRFGRPDALALLSDGQAFRTSGCPDCNRPFYNERPGRTMYNYPRPLTAEEAARALEELEVGNWKLEIGSWKLEEQ